MVFLSRFVVLFTVVLSPLAVVTVVASTTAPMLSEASAKLSSMHLLIPPMM